MRNFRKFSSILLAVLLITSLVMPAFASGVRHSISNVIVVMPPKDSATPPDDTTTGGDKPSGHLDLPEDSTGKTPLLDENGDPVFDEDGNLLYEEDQKPLVDENGNPIEYDADGNPIVKEDPPVDEPLVDENGNPLFDEDGNPIEYDEDGNPIPKDKPLFDENGNPLYDENGNPLYDENGNPLYDENGNPLFDANGNPLYDENGNPLVDENGNPLFDENGNPIEYDEFGNPIIPGIDGLDIMTNDEFITTDLTEVEFPENASVTIQAAIRQMNPDGPPTYGDHALLTAKLIGLEGFRLRLQWQQCKEPENPDGVWFDVQDASSPELTFVMTEENGHDAWRLKVTCYARVTTTTVTQPAGTTPENDGSNLPAEGSGQPENPPTVVNDPPQDPEIVA